jgi:hypothetical protein
MNERIRELAIQSGLPTALDYHQKRYEKFAELIVKECLEVIGNGRFSNTECEGNSHRVSYNNGRYGAVSDIKKHFGVER